MPHKSAIVFFFFWFCYYAHTTSKIERKNLVSPSHAHSLTQAHIRTNSPAFFLSTHGHKHKKDKEKKGGRVKVSRDQRHHRACEVKALFSIRIWRETTSPPHFYFHISGVAVDDVSYEVMLLFLQDYVGQNKGETDREDRLSDQPSHFFFHRSALICAFTY